jgi:hypothetical protein
MPNRVDTVVRIPIETPKLRRCSRVPSKATRAETVTHVEVKYISNDRRHRSRWEVTCQLLINAVIGKVDSGAAARVN